MAGYGSTPGERRGGRQRGTPNKVTQSVKEAILEALHAGEGAAAFFASLKSEDPKTFAQPCGKLIPRQLTGPDDKSLVPEPERFSNVEVARRLCFILAAAQHELDQRARKNGKEEGSHTAGSPLDSLNAYTTGEGI
jgi:hypothetical protein